MPTYTLIANLLAENWITVLISFILLSWVIVYWFRGFVDFLRGLKPVKDGWPNLVNSFDSLVKRVEDIAQELNILTGEFRTLRSQLPGGLTASHSPVRLTQKGQEIANLVNADSIIQKYAIKLDLPENKTAYAIQSACFEFASKILPDLLEQGESESIENTAFAQGISKLSIFESVFGILLRDRILAQQGMALPPDDESET